MVRVRWTDTFCPWTNVFSDSTVIPEATVVETALLLRCCFFVRMEGNHSTEQKTRAHSRTCGAGAFEGFVAYQKNGSQLSQLERGRYLL